MNALNILLDGGLLSASLVACFYCVLLSRRVRRLASADQGVGKGIVDMVQAVERLNASLERTRMAARTESDTLRHQLTEAKALSEKTAELLEDGDHQIGDLSRGLAEARRIVAALEDMADTADRRHTVAQKTPPQPTPILLEEEWDQDNDGGTIEDEDEDEDEDEYEDETPPPKPKAKPTARRRRKPQAGPTAKVVTDQTDDDDITMLLLDAIGLDVSEHAGDPLPDVRPRPSRRARTGARSAAVEA
jgi:hypothetical protein